MTQRQDSLTDQMRSVLVWARDNGCYDAYDWIVDAFLHTSTGSPLSVSANMRRRAPEPYSRCFCGEWVFGPGETQRHYRGRIHKRYQACYQPPGTT